jgi:hypothetical protein
MLKTREESKRKNGKLRKIGCKKEQTRLVEEDVREEGERKIC